MTDQIDIEFYWRFLAELKKEFENPSWLVKELDDLKAMREVRSESSSRDSHS